MKALTKEQMIISGQDNELSVVFNQTKFVIDGLLKPLEDYLRGSFVVSHIDCANYLTDEEFKKLQGLVRKVELLKVKK